MLSGQHKARILSRLATRGFPEMGVGVLASRHTPCHPLIICRPRPRNKRELDEEGKRTSFTFNIGVQISEVVIVGEETIVARSRGKTEGP
jgi:hypothetical protein